MQKSYFTFKCRIYLLLLENDAIGQADGHNTWIPAGHCAQKIFFMLQHYSYRPVVWHDLEKVMNQNWWSSGLEVPRYASLESYRAIGPLLPDLSIWGKELDFLIVLQCRCHDLISDLRSPNKKIIDMHFVKVHWLTSHARFQSPRSWPKADQHYFNWPYLVTWSDLTWTSKSGRRCKRYYREATENLVALRLTVFSYMLKTSSCGWFHTFSPATALVNGVVSE